MSVITDDGPFYETHRSILSNGVGLVGPRIELSNGSISEGAADNTKVGDLSVANGSGTYAFTITSDPDNKFAIANDDELIIDELLNYETATSHQVTIEADNSVDDPISRTFTISVIDVEPETTPFERIYAPGVYANETGSRQYMVAPGVYLNDTAIA